jgi:hypothetical protein
MTRFLRRVFLATLLALGVLAYERFIQPPSPEEMRRLRDECQRLQADIEKRTAAELADVPRTAVVIGIPSPLAERLAGDMVERLAPEIRLRLRDLKIQQEGEVRGKILIGKSRIGRFALGIDLEQVDAQLRPGRPRLAIAGDRLKLQLPVALAAGSGRGRMSFRWDGQGVAGAICGDVDIAGAVGGSLVPATYALEGTFQLIASGPTLVARPAFEDARLTMRVEPNADTWKMVDDAIHRQGAVCRGAMSIADVHGKVHSLVGRGFPVTLPKSLLRDVPFPAALEGTVSEGGTDRFRITPVAIRCTRGALWYGADVTLTRGASAASTPATPP